MGKSPIAAPAEEPALTSAKAALAAAATVALEKLPDARFDAHVLRTKLENKNMSGATLTSDEIVALAILRIEDVQYDSANSDLLIAQAGKLAKRAEALNLSKLLKTTNAMLAKDKAKIEKVASNLKDMAMTIDNIGRVIDAVIAVAGKLP
jgi:hypothetical protein